MNDNASKRQGHSHLKDTVISLSGNPVESNRDGVDRGLRVRPDTRRLSRVRLIGDATNVAESVKRMISSASAEIFAGAR